MPFGPLELGLVAFVLVLLFGIGKLGSIGGALGKSIREFRREIKDSDGSSQPMGEK